MAFIGINVKPEVARLFRDLDVPGEKEQENQYHITIAFFDGELKPKDISKIMETTFEITKDFKPFNVKTSKLTCFSGGEKVPVIAKIKSKELMELNDKLKSAYDDNNINYSKLYDYNPHITLSYSDNKIEDVDFDEIEFLVSEIVLWAGDNGDDKLFITFPLKSLSKTAYVEKLLKSIDKLLK